MECFLFYEAPFTLQSNSDKVFCNEVVKDLKTRWPCVKIVHDQNRCRHSWGSTNGTNQEVKAHDDTRW